MNPSYLEENKNFDFSNERIKKLVEKIDNNTTSLSPTAFALEAYYYIRDAWTYNPYRLSFIEEDWQASKICTHKTGHCLDKAILFITVLRAKNIPARLGLAKVKNHIAVEDIIKIFGNDVLVPHGYVELYLNEKWVKATPAFNKSLCEKLNLSPLDFDGLNDSLFQAYDNSGTKVFMEYIEDYGTFNNVPLAYILDLMKKTYPTIREKKIELGMILNLDKLS